MHRLCPGYETNHAEGQKVGNVTKKWSSTRSLDGTKRAASKGARRVAESDLRDLLAEAKAEAAKWSKAKRDAMRSFVEGK